MAGFAPILNVRITERHLFFGRKNVYEKIIWIAIAFAERYECLSEFALLEYNFPPFHR